MENKNKCPMCGAEFSTEFGSPEMQDFYVENVTGDNAKITEIFVCAFCHIKFKRTETLLKSSLADFSEKAGFDR